MTAGRTLNTGSQSWCTPPKYVNAIKDFFNGKIHLDPCSNDDSIVHAEIEYKLPKNDGLKDSWDYKNIYVNPPYGRDKSTGTSIYDWLGRCYEANITFGSEIIALIPVATNTSHRKDFVFGRADAICFLNDTRLKFMVGGKMHDKGAPMACCLIYRGARKEYFAETFQEYGAVLFMESDKRPLEKTLRKLKTIEAGSLFR